MAKNIVVVVVILIAVIFYYWFFVRIPPLTTINLKIKNKNYSLEVAKTLSQKSQGLMNRNSLCEKCGMIFISSQETPQIFWMKNTLIPLDMIFLDSKGKVTNIETAIPEAGVADLNLKLYRSASPAQYVIELNSGDSQKLGLNSGDIIDIPTNL
jgi:uncharacterized membrane protein (UPF0127 family)